MVLYHKIRKMLLQIAKKSKRHENRPLRVSGAAGGRQIKEKERAKRPVPAGGKGHFSVMTLSTFS